MPLSGKLVLISGASRGIGEAVALELAKANATVIGTATSAAGAEKITQALSEYQGQGLVLDVQCADSIKALFSTLEQKFKMPDILINNAGITKDNLIIRMKDSEWDSVIDTNLSGVFRLSKACLKSMMKQRWGRIINISSVVAALGNPGQANYAAAKSGLIGLTKSMARELGVRNITVNAIAPGFIKTDMTKQLDENQQQNLKDLIPLNRMGESSEIAYAVSFLASERAAYITGETLHINGGMYMS